MFRSIRDFVAKQIDMIFKRNLNDKDKLIEKIRRMNFSWQEDDIEGYTTNPISLPDGRMIQFSLWFDHDTGKVILKYAIEMQPDELFPESEMITISSWRARRFYLELKLETQTKREWLVKERVSTFNRLIDSI